jgi:ribosomal protein S27AE
MRNPALIAAIQKSSNFSRGMITNKKECPKCQGQMSAVFFDFDVEFEQLEEYKCIKCDYIEPQVVGYPRFMERPLLESEGEKFYKSKCPYIGNDNG